MKVYIYTDKGWKNEEEVLTPSLWKVKKNSKYKPIEEHDMLTKKFREEMPFVVVTRNMYVIQSVH